MRSRFQLHLLAIKIHTIIYLQPMKYIYIHIFIILFIIGLSMRSTMLKRLKTYDLGFINLKKIISKSLWNLICCHFWHLLNIINFLFFPHDNVIKSVEGFKISFSNKKKNINSIKIIKLIIYLKQVSSILLLLFIYFFSFSLKFYFWNEIIR